MKTKSSFWDGWVRIRGGGFRDTETYYLVARNPLSTDKWTNMACPNNFVTDNCGIRGYRR